MTTRMRFGWLVLVTGCATVDPRPDYERAAERIARTTGAAESFRPDDAEAIAARVAELRGGGLSADEAVQVALLNNPKLAAAFLEVGVARAELVQSGLLSNPSLMTSVRFPDGGGLAMVDFGIAQNFAELWQIPARKRAASSHLEQSILQLVREASLLAVEVRTDYYRAVAAGRTWEIAVENRDVAKQLFDAVLARQLAGAGSQVDVNLARSELLETELAVRTSTLAAFEARRTLAVLLGLDDPPTELVLSDPVPDVATWSFSIEQLGQAARENRPDLQAAEHAVEAAEARWVEEQRKVFPSLEVGLALERKERAPGSDSNLLAETARSSIEAGELTLPGPRERDDNSQDTLIGPSFGMELPIFDQNQAQIAKAAYELERARRLRDALLLEATQDVRGAYERARTAWDVSSFYRDHLLPLRATNLALAREAYRNGSLSFLSVMETQRALLADRSRHIDALRDAAIAFVDIEKAVGLPVRALMEMGSEGGEAPGDPNAHSLER